MPSNPPPDEVVNVATHLAQAARERPRAAAVILPGRKGTTTLTCAELDADATRIAAGLTALGAGRGVRAVLAVPPGPDFFALVFGMFRAGTVPVVVDPGMGLTSVKTCLEDARPEAFLGIPKAHAARMALGLGGGAVKVSVVVGSRFGLGGVTMAEVRRRGDAAGNFVPAPTTASETAAILFTSGSTGPPRGAVYTHGNFAAQVAALRGLFRFGEDEIDLPTFPLFALFDPALGMTTVFPEMDPARPAKADPRRIAATLQDHGVTTMFGSPALLGPLGLHAEGKSLRFPRLRRVLCAGAPVPTEVVRRMARALPDDGELFTPYGATECLPVACIGHREILGETAERTARGDGVCVGRPAPGVRIEILRIDDGPLLTWSDDLRAARGEVGEIAVRAPQATASYFARPDADAHSKIAVEGGGFLHRMGDLGRLDDAGRLWFMGRKSERVETQAGSIPTGPAEGILDAHPGVRRSALAAVGRRGAQRAVACIERADGAPDDGTLLGELRTLAAGHPATASIVDFLIHPGFPVDTRHNAKIRRGDLARWAEGKIRP